MSTIDLSNPKVLKNFLLAQLREGKGKVISKKDVLCFTNKDGLEFIVPDEYRKEFEKGEEIKQIIVEDKTEIEHKIENISIEHKIENISKELDKNINEELEKLKEEAFELGIVGYSTLNKEELTKKIDKIKKV